MKSLDLFSGIGGMTLALQDYVNPIGYCEINDYCKKVLEKKMQEGLLPTAKIYDDIRKINPKDLPPCEIVYGGFPCQNISVAGNGKGLDGEQSKLFFEIIRLCSYIKPKFIFLENVPAITKRGGVEVVREITTLGYDCRWCIISAKSIGFPHVRKRWFLLAYSNSKSGSGLSFGKKKRQPKFRSNIEYKKWNFWNEDESTLLGKDDGIPYRVDRIKCLGNSVIPLQAKTAFEILIGLF